MGDAIHFEGTVSPEIFYKAQRLHSRRRSAIIVLAISFGAVLIGVTSWISEDVNIVSIAVLAFAVVTLLIHFGLRKYRLSRVYEKTPYLREKVSGTITRES